MSIFNGKDKSSANRRRAPVLGNVSAKPDLEEQKIAEAKAARLKREAAALNEEAEARNAENARAAARVSAERDEVDYHCAEMSQYTDQSRDFVERHSPEFVAKCQELLTFRQERGLTRTAKVPDKVQTAAIVAVTGAVETMMMRNFFAGSGFLPTEEACMQFALSITCASAMLAFLASYICLPRAHYLRVITPRDATEKRWARVGLVTCLVFSLILHISVSVVRSAEAGSTSEIVQEVLNNPLLLMPWYSLVSLIAFLSGVAASCLYLWKFAVGLADPVPQYTEVWEAVTSLRNEVLTYCEEQIVLLKKDTTSAIKGKTDNNITTLKQEALKVENEIREIMRDFCRFEEETENQLREERYQ